ncbi:hypothetical protein ANO14919_069900 [Xylariales sp. No.14919]|nr:hypothetical protein ANO14919_069900 [Xylariales sp. No.14919]
MFTRFTAVAICDMPTAFILALPPVNKASGEEADEFSERG